MDPVAWYERFKKAWDLFAPFLRRADTWLILVSVCLAYVVALFHSTYEYWPVTIRVLSIVSVAAFVVAVVCSRLSPFAHAWRPYGAAALLSLAFLTWLGSAAFFYVYPALLLLAIPFALRKGASNASSS